jgi:hypothetical protein
MRKNPFRITVLGCLCLGAGFAQAQSTGHYTDAAQFMIDPAAHYTIAVGGGSLQSLAQTMTIEQPGHVMGVFLPVICGTGMVSVELRDVAPGDLPGSRVFDAAVVPASDIGYHNLHFTYIEFQGQRKVKAKPGTKLAVVVSNPGGSCAMNAAPVAVDYRGGRGSFEALPNPPGFVHFGDFPDTPDDLPFQLVLAP